MSSAVKFTVLKEGKLLVFTNSWKNGILANHKLVEGKHTLVFGHDGTYGLAFLVEYFKSNTGWTSSFRPLGKHIGLDIKSSEFKIKGFLSYELDLIFRFAFKKYFDFFWFKHT